MLRILFAVLLALAACRAQADECLVGAYRLGDASLDIAPSDGGLRWRHVEGATGLLVADGAGGWTSLEGWTGRPDGHRIEFAGCAQGELRFDGVAARRIPLRVTETAFAGRDGVSLAGRLLMPEGEAVVPLVVLIHGAENLSARRWDFMQRQLPAEGVAAFVYDKRGTGESGGQYTQDYDVLADDAVAALAEARRLGGARIGRSGFRGGSQGGWVAPLAATRTSADFVIAAYGLAVSPVEEDREAVILQMQLKGHGADVIESALEIVDAAAEVARSRFTAGIDAFDAVRARYRDEPWYDDVHGNFTHLLLPHYGEALRREGQAYNFGTPWDYDAMAVLRGLRTPQLWQLAEADIDAPMGETFRRLRRLVREQDAPVGIAVFPGAEHGMTLFETAADGSRTSLRYPAGYTRMTVDFAKGRLAGDYGDARLYLPD
ncbi:alpha/beta hydrolase [Luteimonas composti]|uniref:Alpha/beta hydrolase n=1 Tax=Luteimonas composti TaxID=398257 RepID=A0ABT6MPM0_9GAMM|nr:alpha/beta hydrolase [Luteimonas composti]MDH7452300.1 alpha/beta hydrolase [Luteimonas composti]